MQTQSLLARLDARDRALYLRSVAWDASALEQAFWRTVTHLGGAPITIGVVLALALISPDGLLGVAGTAGAALAATHLIAVALKTSIGRPRPSQLAGAPLIATPACFSFPSGHSTAASTLAFVFAWHAPALSAPLLLTAALVGASRVRLGVHYPGDVLAGQGVALLGTIAVLAAF